MANNFDSNFTRQIAEPLLKSFENKRILSKNVDTQLLSGKFNKDSGDIVDFRRPTDYLSTRTPKGDISATTAQPIITGKASGVVQDYITVEMDYSEADEALKMGDTSRFFDNAAQRLVTDLELDFGVFMMSNAGLKSGVAGNAIKTWKDIANQGAVMSSIGVPKDDMWCSAVNSFAQTELSNDQRSLGGETGDMSANKMATITENFAGMKVLACDSLATYTTGTGADRAGTLAANPVATYLSAKDTMTQQLAVTGLEPNLVVAAGESITIAGRNRLNLATRKPIVDGNGAQILFSGTVTEAVTLDGSGAGTLTVSGPAIFETDGAYNTVSSLPVAGDVVTLGGSADTLIQPSMFWHRQAFSIGSVPIKKLNSTDTLAKTKDGLQIRVSKGVSVRENKQIVRLDLRPAFSCLNPFFAGQGYGL